MQNIKYNSLLAINIFSLFITISTILLYPNFLFLGIIIVLINLIHGYRLYKLINGLNIKLGDLSSLVSTKFVWFTYISAIVFIILYFVLFYTKGLELATQAYIFYFVFYFFSPYMFNYYTKNQIVIYGDVIDKNDIKMITNIVKDKKNKKINLEIHRNNGRKVLKLSLNPQEFDDLKLKLNLYTYVKY